VLYGSICIEKNVTDGEQGQYIFCTVFSQWSEPLNKDYVPIPRGTPSAENTRAWEIFWFLTEIAVYLVNGTR